MQGNKKQADGQSDSSSLGSLLDETDREVSSLTDRAFKSLCLDELETSDPEAGLAVSPHLQHPFSSKYFQGPRNRAVRKNIAPNKLLPQTGEHSTFQRFPKHTQEAERAAPNSVPQARRKLGLLVPNLRHYKHPSKVSSLIKTFDQGETQEAPAPVAQPVKNHLPKCPSIYGANMVLWGGKSILNIPKELSEFPGACPKEGEGHGRHEMYKRPPNPMDLLGPGPPRLPPAPAALPHLPQSRVSTFSSQKGVKKRPGKAKVSTPRGSFLHSENSAFESWNAHHKKLAGIGGSPEGWPSEESLAYLEEMPHLQDPGRLGHWLSSPEAAGSVVLQLDISSDASPQSLLPPLSLSPVSPCQSPCVPLSTVPLPPSSGLAMCVDRNPTPPPLPPKVPFPRALSPQGMAASPGPMATAPLPQSSLPPEASPLSTPDPHLPGVTLHPEKTNHLGHDPEMGKVCPPWRRQKAVLKGTEVAADVGGERKDSVQRSSSGVTSLANVATADSHTATSDASSPSFNLTQLLTPLLPAKQEKEPSGSPSQGVTPPLLEAEAATEPEERAFCNSQNNYKSKASSLLFNLKDIRKRVKSTYSPSPLLRALEDKKKSKEPDGLKVSGNHRLGGSRSKSPEQERANLVPKEPPGEMGSPRTAHSTRHLQGNLRPLSSPPAKSDSPRDQKRKQLPQEKSVDLEDGELVTAFEFLPRDHLLSQRPPAPKAEQGRHLQKASLEDPPKGTQSHRAYGGPQESPSLFFTAEENVNDRENQACPETGTEQKDKRSSSSSEQSFVSIVDQPSHEESFSLMQLFQKACLQESQRNRDKGSAEEKPSSKEEEGEEEGEEKSGRPEEAWHDHSLSNDDSNTGGKSNGKVEQNKMEKDLPQEQLQGERREGRGQGLDSASEGKSEEPLTPASSSSFKPNMFQIKDNTFKSPPVIKAVKLPLFRSLSCDGALAGGYREGEKQAYGPFQATPVSQETDWPLSRNRRQQRTWRGATTREGDEPGYGPAQEGGQGPEKDRLAADSTLQEELRSIYEQQQAKIEEGTSVTQGTPQNEDQDLEKWPIRDKERDGARKLRPSSASQLHPEGDLLAQNKTQSPTREKTHYYKNNLLSKRRSSSCVKKVITQESRSPTNSEIQAHSPAFSDAFGDTLCTPSLASSTVPSPRSDSTMFSAFTSPFSDTAATCSTTQAEKTAASSSPHRGRRSEVNPSVAEAPEPTQASQLAGPPEGSPETDERPQRMKQMVKTAAKPPAVPPKTEKALRRAKKLASRRKKVETQPKKPAAEPAPPCEDITPLSFAQSPLLPAHLSSPVVPSKSNQVTLPTIPSSPTPSSPATQRKLLQDPDSGEYFMVDLPTQFKTLYDPESGRYVQVSLPSYKRNLSQRPSSEVLAPPYVLYPSSLPLRVSSVPARASPSQLSESASLIGGGALSESAPDWQQDGYYPEALNSQPYLEPAVCEVEHTREDDRPPFNFERDVSLSDKADMISLGAIEDFAIEGIS